jgi:cytochrome P450
LTKTVKPIELHPFLQLACLETGLKAGFSLEVNALQDPKQPLVKNYQRPFRLGQRSPLYLKLLQVCPESIQPQMVSMISKIMGVNISGMKMLLANSLSVCKAAAAVLTSRCLQTAYVSIANVRWQERLRSEKPLMRSKVNPANHRDTMDCLLHRGHTQLSERVLLRHAMTTMAASLEMVSNQMAWALYALSNPCNIHVQQLLRESIRKRFSNVPSSMSWEEISSQPYLLGVVNEILRLCPNTAHRGRVANCNTAVNNLFLPTGTVLTWPVYAINRDPRYWGSDANMFKPERWFTNENGVEPRCRDAFCFMTFGQGPRKCPGEAYTRAVLANMLVALIGRYEFRRPTGYADVMEDGDAIRVKFGIVMKAEIWVDVKEVPGWSSVSTKEPTQ